MEQSIEDHNISLSPSQILERLHVLRQLQIMQQGKLQKQRLDYQGTSESSSSITEIVSHFSNCTSYNTFRSLLEMPNDSLSFSPSTSNNRNLNEKDLIDGVSVLNLSQESEYIKYSPSSTKSRGSALSNDNPIDTSNNRKKEEKNSVVKNRILLDDMPILSPKKDFEALIIEKLKNEVNKDPVKSTISKTKQCIKKPFLRKGDGTTRYGLQKKDFIIQNTKSLPWRRKNLKTSSSKPPSDKPKPESENLIQKVDVLTIQDQNIDDKNSNISSKKLENIYVNLTQSKQVSRSNQNDLSLKECNDLRPKECIDLQEDSSVLKLPQKIIEYPSGKHPLMSSKGKSWASVLSKDQNDFLQRLKQSDYYKNFVSPTKSALSDTSCSETLSKHVYEKEKAEQNMFDLLEGKVSHESFNLNNSFFNRFLRKSQFETSGESTPVVMQQCLEKNPNLVCIYPNINSTKLDLQSQCDEACGSECCSDTCSSVSTCCSCRKVDHPTKFQNESYQEMSMPSIRESSHNSKKDSKHINRVTKCKEVNNASDKVVDNDIVNENDTMKANIVEMNAKLVATSELLRDRLHELEDEIETFRRENANLSKMREDIDLERQKFYEEKSMFEQKLNEEKVLSEFYLADEREKLNKQKLMYEKYVREIRGRLNKKEKEEVVDLKKEISNMKEEMRLKDAKSTSSIARLRNQLKIMEKDKKELQDEIEKLKKENRRILHSNDVTRRLTNIKYLEEINKKLSGMTPKATHSETDLDCDAKYKDFEIEKQSRSRRVQPKSNRLTRAKSVPNLKVTSRYAKYFSQRDAVSDLEKNKSVNVEPLKRYTISSDNEFEVEELHLDNTTQNSDSDDNNLEKLYMERFHSESHSSMNSTSHKDSPTTSSNTNEFFITKGNRKEQKQKASLLQKSVSPASTISNKSSIHRFSNGDYEEYINQKNNTENTNVSYGSNKSRNSKSPLSILTNKTYSSLKPETVINKENFKDTLSVSPEPTSRTSITKTNLNPIEIKNPDGSKELRFPNGNFKFVSPDGKYSKFLYYNGDIKENFYDEGRIKYFYAETKTYHTTHADGLEVLEFPDGQVEKRYKDGSSEIRLPNGSVRYFDPKNAHVREEWRFPDGTSVSVSATGEQRIVFTNGQVEVHAQDHKRREFPDGTVKLVYNDGTSETRYASGRVRVKDKHGNLIMDSATR